MMHIFKFTGRSGNEEKARNSCDKKLFYALTGEKLLNAPTSKKNSWRAQFWVSGNINEQTNSIGMNTTSRTHVVLSKLQCGIKKSSILNKTSRYL